MGTIRNAPRWLVPTVWIAILLITGGFQFYRGAPIDGVVFCAFGILLLADARGLLGRVRPLAWAVPRTAVAATAATGTAILTIVPRHGVVSAVVVIAAGIIALVFAWPERRGEPTTGGPAGRIVRAAFAWSAAGIALCIWEMVMYFLGTYSGDPRSAHPALSDLLDPIVQNPVARAVFVLLWLLGGVALVRRGATK